MATECHERSQYNKTAFYVVIVNQMFELFHKRQINLFIAFSQIMSDLKQKKCTTSKTLRLSIFVKSISRVFFFLVSCLPSYSVRCKPNDEKCVHAHVLRLCCKQSLHVALLIIIPPLTTHQHIFKFTDGNTTSIYSSKLA
jgi:hypothetical protein